MEKTTSAKKVYFTDTSVPVVNMIGGVAFECMAITTSETEKPWLEQARFTRGNEHEWDTSRHGAGDHGERE